MDRFIARIRPKWKKIYSILAPNVVIFVQIQGMDRIFKPNIQPKKKEEKDPVSNINGLYHGAGY